MAILIMTIRLDLLNSISKGRDIGGVPHFWALRFDVGRADMNKPGSWNAYVDYKYFAHGSFFGGNGTEAVPDRYLDGIKSFTFGGGYVPTKDLLYKHSIHLMLRD